MPKALGRRSSAAKLAKAEEEGGPPAAPPYAEGDADALGKYAEARLSRQLRYALDDVVASRPRNPVKMLADVLRSRMPKKAQPRRVAVEDGTLEAAEVRAYVERELSEPLHEALVAVLAGRHEHDADDLTAALAAALDRVANAGDYSARNAASGRYVTPPWRAGDADSSPVSSPAASLAARVGEAVEEMEFAVEAALEAAASVSPSKGSQHAAVAGATTGSTVLSEALAAASQAAQTARQDGAPKLVVLEALRGASIESMGMLRKVEAALDAAGYDVRAEISQQTDVLRLQMERFEETLMIDDL